MTISTHAGGGVKHRSAAPDGAKSGPKSVRSSLRVTAVQEYANRCILPEQGRDGASFCRSASTFTMGKARRERVVALTQTRKKLVGRVSKQAVVDDLRGAVDNYGAIYVISMPNMRNTLLKDLRTKWRDSRFFMGRKKIVQVALGRNEAEEYADGLRRVAKQLTGNVGILFTNRDHKDVMTFFEGFEKDDFARSGFVAPEAVKLAEGELEMFETSQENNLRLVGLPVVLKKGKVHLSRDFTVCEAGETLTPEKAKILEFLGLRMAKFRVNLRCYYRKKDGHFEVLDDMVLEESE